MLHVKLFHPDSGAVRTELLAPQEAAAALARLAAQGWTELSRQESRDKVSGTSGQAPRSQLDVAWWCRELRTLLQAGMTVVEALETLQAQSLGADRQALHATLVARLAQGQSLSVAMQATAAFPSVLIAGVKASERTSTLVSALDDYLQYHELLDGLRRKTISAAIYPTLVLALGLVITFFLLVYVIPRFAQMYVDRPDTVSGTTKVLLFISQLFGQHLQLTAVGVAAGVACLTWAWRSGSLAAAGSWLVQEIPVLNRNAREFRLAKLYQSLALMVRGGYALAESLDQCASLQLGGDLSQRISQARQHLEQGRRVSVALADAGLTDSVTTRLLTVGERTGNFDRLLQTVAQRHAGNFSTFIERATRVVEPTMLLLVSMLVGAIVVLMYMPVFDIANSIQG